MTLKRTLVVKAVKSAFKAIGNIPETCTYRRTATAYNPSTGQTTTTNADHTINQAVFCRYETMEIDKVSVLATDLKMIIQKSSLTLTPNVATDKIVRTSENKTYNILRVSQDPAGATYTIQLRSPS